MFDKEAIETLQEGAAIASAHDAVSNALTAEPGTGVTALPSDYELHDLEHFLPLRRRPRGHMRTSALQAFADYARQHVEEGAAVFVDASDMQATAVLNLGTPDQPGHADNLATLQAVKTAAYIALRKAADSYLSQQACAEFLEDWSDHIQCFDADGEPLPNARAVAAVRRVTLESLRKLENVEQTLSAERSTFESVKATSREPLPGMLHFRCKPYADLDERVFVLRFGVKTGDDKPKVWLRIRQEEVHQEAMADELAARVRDACKGIEGLPVLLGSYSKQD